MAADVWKKMAPTQKTVIHLRLDHLLQKDDDTSDVSTAASDCEGSATVWLPIEAWSMRRMQLIQRSLVIQRRQCEQIGSDIHFGADAARALGLSGKALAAEMRPHKLRNLAMHENLFSDPWLVEARSSRGTRAGRKVAARRRKLPRSTAVNSEGNWIDEQLGPAVSAPASPTVQSNSPGAAASAEVRSSSCLPGRDETNWMYGKLRAELEQMCQQAFQQFASKVASDGIGSVAASPSVRPARADVDLPCPASAGDRPAVAMEVAATGDPTADVSMRVDAIQEQLNSLSASLDGRLSVHHAHGTDADAVDKALSDKVVDRVANLEQTSQMFTDQLHLIENKFNDKVLTTAQDFLVAMKNAVTTTNDHFGVVLREARAQSQEELQTFGDLLADKLADADDRILRLATQLEHLGRASPKVSEDSAASRLEARVRALEGDESARHSPAAAVDNTRVGEVEVKIERLTRKLQEAEASSVHANDVQWRFDAINAALETVANHVGIDVQNDQTKSGHDLESILFLDFAQSHSRIFESFCASFKQAHNGTLTVNSRVVLYGLSRHELNGHVGLITSFDSVKHRVGIILLQNRNSV